MGYKMQRRWYQPPPSEVLCISIVFLCHGYMGIKLLIESGLSLWALTLAVIGLTIGVGAWFRCGWARTAAMIATSCMLAYQVYLLVMMPFTSSRLMWLVVWLSQAIAAWRWDRYETVDGDSTPKSDESEPEPLISIAVLLREPKFLDETILTSTIAKAWKVNVDETSGISVVGESPIFVVITPKNWFLIHNRETPYVENVDEVASEISELRLQQAVRNHRAWLAVDVLLSENERTPERVDESYRFIAKLVAALADDQCTALFFPETGKAFVYDAELDQHLQSDKPLEGLNVFPPVMMVEDDEAALAATVAEAQRRWPEFVEAFAARSSDDQPFSIKAPISDGVHTEFMWLMVKRIENAYVHGELGNEPVNVQGVKLGMELRIPVTDVNDWIYVRDEEPVGGFSLRFFAERMNEQKK